MSQAKKRLSGHRRQTANIQIKVDSPNLRLIVEESEKWGKNAYFRVYDAGKEQVAFVKFMAIEDLARLSKHLNDMLLERLEKVKEAAGFM